MIRGLGDRQWPAAPWPAAPWPGARALWLLIATTASAACCPAPRPGGQRFAGLPAGRVALLGLADELVEGRPTLPRLDRALAALQKLAGRRPNDFAVNWRLARGFFWVTELVGARDLKVSYARQGALHAARAAAAAPRRVEGHYYLALNRAKIAEATADLQLIKPVVAAAELARAADERFDRAGPLLLLGKIYLTAPAWPVSVGNPELAIRLLERALRIAPRPLTRVFLGQAYYADERYEEAARQLRQALREADQLKPRWRREAVEALQRIEEESSRRRPTPERVG
jgi:tetratricopeptide (TPR) repeat protein